MKELTPTQLAYAKKSYNKNIRNAKSIKKILEKSWLWANLLDSVNYIIDNYTLDDEVNTGLWDYCHEHKITTLSWYDCISRPFKIKSFSKEYLELIKKQYDAWVKDHYYTYWSYDYSIATDPESKKAWYSAEYKWCWNWHYYLMLDWDTAMFYEDD